VNAPETVFQGEPASHRRPRHYDDNGVADYIAHDKCARFNLAATPSSTTTPGSSSRTGAAAAASARETSLWALGQLRCTKRLELIPGATHLFEESGALEKVGTLAADWFLRYLKPR
jgi:hypothetical protein